MEFLKILWDNLKKGPVTDAFPFGETYTPDRLRGRVEIDPALCVGCGTCVHVCAAGAINISKFEDGSGFEITVWRNSCCLCAQCRQPYPKRLPHRPKTGQQDGAVPERPRPLRHQDADAALCCRDGVAEDQLLPGKVVHQLHARLRRDLPCLRRELSAPVSYTHLTLPTT